MRELSQYKIRKLWTCYNDNVGPHQASFMAHVSEPTAYKYYALWRSGYVPEFCLVKTIVNDLDKKVKCAWRMEAVRRHVPVKVLVTQVLRIIARDDMFNAILEVPKYAPESRNKKYRTIKNAV